MRTLAFEAPRLYQRYLDGQSAEDIWFEINRPFPSHMRQGQLYLWMAWPVYERIVFLYEFKPTQQAKEFVVEYNKSLTGRPLARNCQGCDIGQSRSRTATGSPFLGQRTHRVRSAFRVSIGERVGA